LPLSFSTGDMGDRKKEFNPSHPRWRTSLFVGVWLSVSLEEHQATCDSPGITPEPLGICRNGAWTAK